MSILKCKSRIERTYKRSKAASLYPKFCPAGKWIDNPNAVDLPECGGDVEIIISARAGRYFADVELNVEEKCTNCRYPFHDLTPILLKFDDSGEINLTKLLEEYERREERN